MSGRACVAAAADLADLAARLDGAALALARQSRLSEHDFGGLSGTSFRRHVARSALVAVEAAGDVALLAAALGTLGRGLAVVEGCRERALSADQPTADRLAARADRLEERAQAEWRAALGRFDGAGTGSGQGDDRSAPEEPTPLPTTPATGARGAGPSRAGLGRAWSVAEEGTDEAR